MMLCSRGRYVVDTVVEDEDMSKVELTRELLDRIRQVIVGDIKRLRGYIKTYNEQHAGDDPLTLSPDLSSLATARERLNDGTYTSSDITEEMTRQCSR